MKSILVSVFLAVPFIISAQFTLGVSAGGLTSFIAGQNNYGYPELDYNRKFGFSGGVSAKYSLNEKTTLGVELNYILVGQDYTANINGVSHAKEQDLYYFQIPVLLKYNFASSEKRNLYIQGGLFAAFIRKAEIVWTRENQVINFREFHTYENLNPNAAEIIADFGGGDAPDAYKDLFKNVSFGCIVGIGKEWTAKEKSNFFLELQSGFIFTDVNASNYRYDAPTGSYQSSHPIFIGFRLGWNFKL